MKVLIFGYGNKTTAAASNILLNLSKLIVEKENIEIVLFGYDENRNIKSLNDKITISSIRYPFGKLTFNRYRLLRKFNKLFKKDDLCLSWQYLYKNALKVFKDEKFDYVIGASGPFCYMNAAFEYSKKTNTKFGMIYFDPFTNSISSFVNKNKRIALEKRWYERSSFIFEERNSNKLPFEDKKNIALVYDIPMFAKPFTGFEHGAVIYGGNFYKNFRSTELLLDFLSKDYCKKETFKVFSNRKESFENVQNVISLDLKDSDIFEKECSNAKAIIVIGNGKDSKTYPSKLIDAISYKKPIIGININADFVKYPFLYSGDDEKLFDKINAIKNADLESLDLYKIFPIRDPQIFVSNLLGSLRK